MKTRPSSILFVLLCTVFTSAGQVLYKFASSKLSLNIYALLANYELILGLVFYFIGAVLLLLALRSGELSVLYPIISLSFVWVSLLSREFFSEQVNILQWLGIIIILLGITLIGLSSRNSKRTLKREMEQKRKSHSRSSS